MLQKIGITSFQFSNNYGALLQAYSLQKHCLNYANLVKHINYIPYLYFVSPYEETKYKKLKIGVRIYKWLRRFICAYFYGKRSWRSPINTKFSVLKKMSFYNAKDTNVYITGSDQIWNPLFIWKREKIYFLVFGNKKAKRISYAASLGVKKWPKDFEQKVLPMLQCFDAISVREESAVTYLTSLGLKNVVCVCDPTILHNGDFYRNEFLYEKTTESFTFVYKIREVIPEYLKELFEKNVRYVDLGKRKNVVSVTDWLANIDNAKFIVTDSFHCAVFCILFHKPFLVLPNRGAMQGMNERFETLLGKTNLKYRVLSSEDTKEVALAKLNTPIDWDKIDSIMEEWRNYSANWLKKALEK